MTSLWAALAEAERQGEAVVVCTVVRTAGAAPRHAGSKMLVYPDGHIDGTVGGGEIENQVRRVAEQALRDGQPQLRQYQLVDPEKGDVAVCGGSMDIFVEPVLPQPTLLIIGGGHVGRAVARLGKFLGFRVVVSDDRPEFCTPESVPEADLCVLAPMLDLPAHISFNPQTYVVLVTRGTEVDVAGLPVLLEQSWAYLGVIGSRRRWLTTARELAGRGVKPENLARIHSPIGLELNAETPEEIAVSILAEIIMLRRGGDGKPMQASSQGLGD